MSFEVFTAYGAASRPEATLRSSGYLFLSRGIVKRAGHEHATHYQLMFDEALNRLGIRLLTRPDGADDDESIRAASVENSGIALNAMPLLRYFGFKFKGKHKFPVTFEQDLIVIDLSDLRKGGEDPQMF